MIGKRAPTDLGVFAGFGGTYWEGVRRIQSECVSFMAQRLDDDRKTLEALAGCKQVADVVEVQQRWAARCSESYMREGPKLAAMAIESFGVPPPGTGPQ